MLTRLIRNTMPLLDKRIIVEAGMSPCMRKNEVSLNVVNGISLQIHNGDPPDDEISSRASTCTTISQKNNLSDITEDSLLLHAMVNYLICLCSTSVAPRNVIPATRNFMGARTPPISIDRNLARICRYMNKFYQEEEYFLEGSSGVRCLFGGLVYLTRLAHCTEINSKNLHRLVLTCTLMAHKVMEDECAQNEFFSRVGGITLQEVNCLEGALCSVLEFRMNLHVDEMTTVIDSVRGYLYM